MPSLGARWIFDGLGSVYEDGLLVWHQDRIVAVMPGRRSEAERDLGHVILVPGLVNAHTHLDLSDRQAEQTPGRASDWLSHIIEHRRQATAESVQQAIRRGIRQLLRFGVTLVGDIAATCHTLAVCSEFPLRATVYCEIVGLTKERARLAWRSAQNTLVRRFVGSRCRIGLSPHAPYSTRKSLFCLAVRQRLPLAVHLAEFFEERELVESGTGPFRDWLKALGVWDARAIVNGYGQLLDVLQNAPSLILVHVNYPTTEVLKRVRLWATSGKVGVVYCPRTHAYFGHPPHCWREWLQWGIPLAIGTDSLASNPDLNPLGELRWVWRGAPGITAEKLWQLITSEAARLLGWHEAGCLTPGQLADFVAFPLPDSVQKEPLEALLEYEIHPSLVYIGGHVVFDGEEARFEGDFAKANRK